MMGRSRANCVDKQRIAQRARRDAERDQRPPREGPPILAHGEPVGRIVLEMHGQRVEARLLATGRHCRSYGVEIDGVVLGVMDADRAWSEVSRRVARLRSPRSDFWFDESLPTITESPAPARRAGTLRPLAAAQ